MAVMTWQTSATTIGRRKAAAVTLALLALLGVTAVAYEQQLQTLCAELATKLAAADRKTVAVVDFTDLQGNVTELGRFLAEEVSVRLAADARGLEVIDRMHLKTILQEHKLGASGVIDPQTAVKLGELAGAQALVTGTLTPFGDSVRLAVKVLDTKTARMVTAALVELPKTKTIEELLSRGIGGAATPPGGQTSSGNQLRTSGGVAATSASALPTRQEQLVAGITWQLMGCRRDRQVTCKVMATHSQRGELRVQLGTGSALDERGSDYTCSGGSGFYSRQSFLRLIPGANEIVPITCVVPIDVAVLSQLELRFTDQDRVARFLRFRHVSID